MNPAACPCRSLIALTANCRPPGDPVQRVLVLGGFPAADVRPDDSFWLGPYPLLVVGVLLGNVAIFAMALSMPLAPEPQGCPASY